MRRFGSAAMLSAALTLAACGGGGPEAGFPAPAGAGGSPRAVPAGRVQGGGAHYENVIEMIRGKAPGLEVLQTQPGVIELRVRGMNQSLQATGQEPLVVIDGVPSARPAGQALLALNPNDVGSIQVLKDVGSTAVYGTRGANGVILISLKRRGGRIP